MERTSAVQDAIEARYPGFTGHNRRIADYLVQHRSTAFALSIQELARAIGVSQATIVRFARAIGLDGYQELRTALTDEARAELTPSARFAATAVTPATTLERVAAKEVDNINRTLVSCSAQAIARARTVLCAAEHVAAVGAGVSSLLAQLITYQLQLVGVPASAISGGPLTLPEQIELLPRKSAVMCFGFPPYSRATIRAAERARDLKFPVIAITDGIRSPLSQVATTTLAVEAQNLLFTNSLSATLVVINTLVTDVALANKPRALARIAALDAAGASDHVR